MNNQTWNGKLPRPYWGGKFDTVESNTPVEAGCLISVNLTADSKRDGGMMRRLSQSLVELQGAAKEPIRRDDTKEEV